MRSSTSPDPLGEHHQLTTTHFHPKTRLPLPTVRTFQKRLCFTASYLSEKTIKISKIDVRDCKLTNHHILTLKSTSACFYYSHLLRDTARYDHHCPWINNCVGLLNLRWFLLFLFFTALLINYVTYLSSMILMGIIESNNLWYYADARGRLQETPYSYIFQYLVYSAVAVVGLWIFTIFIGAVVYCFLGYHLWLISRGTTTNETFKWSDFESEQKQLRRLQQKRSKNSSISADDFEDALADMPLVKAKVIRNIYNRGIIQNFREVFFPLDPANRHPVTLPSPKLTPRGSRPSTPVAPAATTTTEKPRETKKNR